MSVKCYYCGIDVDLDASESCYCVECEKMLDKNPDMRYMKYQEITMAEWDELQLYTSSDVAIPS